MAGRAQQRIKRTIITGAAFVPNGQLTIPLPRNYDVETLVVTLRGSITTPATAFVAGSNAFGPAIRSDAPFGLIPRVEVILEGRQTVLSVPARILGMANVWRRRQPFWPTQADTFADTQKPPLVRNAGTATTAIAVATTYPIACTFEIDFQYLKGIRPKDTNLRSGGLQTFDLKLTFADLSSIFYQPSSTLLTTPFSAPAIGATLGANSGGATSLGVLNACTIDVYDVELEELKGADNRLSTPGFVQRWTNQTVNIAAANSALETLLPTDNYIGAIILAPTIGGEATDTVLTNIIARRGTDQRISLPANNLAALMEREYEHPRFPGYYVLDFASSGAVQAKMPDAWNVQGGADTRLVASVANPGTNVSMDITTVEFIPIGR